MVNDAQPLSGSFCQKAGNLFMLPGRVVVTDFNEAAGIFGHQQ
jgi:hypothetical protein